MRIGFVGAGGTGKTTVLKLLGDLGLPQLSSVSRAVFAKWGWTEADQRNASPQECWKLQREIFDAFVKQDSENPNFIADRTLLDHYCYSLYRAGKGMDASNVKAMEELTKENLAKLDFLFYFPVGYFVPEDDGMRENDPAYRVLFDAMVRGFLGKFKVDYRVMPPGTPEARAAFVRAVIASGQKSSGEGSLTKIRQVGVAD